jgi:hypothetical protein
MIYNNLHLKYITKIIYFHRSIDGSSHVKGCIT